MGQSILESYSRILESLAFTVMSRIEDVMYADSLAQNPSLAQTGRKPSAVCLPLTGSTREETEKNPTETQTPTSMTLSDFMGWHLMGDTEPGRSSSGNSDDLKDDSSMLAGKLNKVAIHKKSNSYLDKLENLGGLRSPTSRH